MLAYRWRYRGIIPSFEDFVRQLHGDILAQFVVRDSRTGQRIGHVVAYAADLRNRHVFIANVNDVDRVGTRIGTESQILFIDYLLSLWDFRKIYVEVPGFIYEPIAEHIGSFFAVEGRLSQHCFYKGRYWDQIILAVTRDEWEES